MNVKLKFNFVATVILVIALSGCKDDAQPAQQKYPYVIATDVSNVTENGAVFNGEFSVQGTSVITDYGFEWTYQMPSAGTKYYRRSLGNTKTDKFSASITSDLWSFKNYFVRAYAITADNNIYSSPVIFKSAGSMPPEITSISPTHGPANTEIVITGKNFGQGNPLNEKTVSLGYYNFMTIVSFSDTRIVVKPPQFSPKGTYNIELTFEAKRYVFNSVSFTYE